MTLPPSAVPTLAPSKPRSASLHFIAGLLRRVASVILYLPKALAHWIASQSWIGFGAYSSPDGKITVRGKTVWDWMQLIIVPTTLALGLFLLNQAANANERAIAADRDRETALENYIERMQDLLLNYELRSSNREQQPQGDAVLMAQTLTFTTLERLDSQRKFTVVDFLSRARLITGTNPVFRIYGADLSGADLTDANLSYTNFSGADLSEANLSGSRLRYVGFDEADLSNAYLSGISLYETSFVEADLSDADLSGAHLFVVDLSNAILPGANLSDAELPASNLSYANLSYANLSYANLSGNDIGPLGMTAGADLSNANLAYANLSYADLSGDILGSSGMTAAVNLSNADLSNANLRGANVTDEQLASAHSLAGATMPDGTIHP